MPWMIAGNCASASLPSRFMWPKAYIFILSTSIFARSKNSIAEADTLSPLFSRLGLYGGLIFTPVVVPWYRIIDRVKFASRPASIAAKVALDQCIFAPFAVGLFFTSTTLMEGKTLEDVKAKLQKVSITLASPYFRTKVGDIEWGKFYLNSSQSYTSTVKANWMLFVPFQTINMGFVPLQHRLLAVNVISLFWNTYLSLASAAGTEPPKQSIEKKGDE
ncbi:Protein required for ethanol metabolism, partial [Tulasnella sp. 417]